MQVLNQKPTVLNPNFAHDYTCPLDFGQDVTALFTAPIFQSNVKFPVQIIDGGKKLEPADLTNLIIESCDDVIGDYEQKLREIFQDALANYQARDDNLFQHVFANQSATRAGLPLPDSSTIYSCKHDVAPSSKQYFDAPSQKALDEFFASLAFTYHPDTIGLIVKNQEAFKDFCQFLSLRAHCEPNLDSTAQTLVKNFCDLDLSDSLTEVIQLRFDHETSNEPYGFARFLQAKLYEYVQKIQTQNNFEIALAPFMVSQLLHPLTLTIINAQNHSDANTQEITKEWRLVNMALSNPIRILDQNQLLSLKAVAKHRDHLKKAARVNRKPENLRSKYERFDKKNICPEAFLRHIFAVIQALTNVNKSHNVYTQVKSTFNRANRRNPDDFNLQGKMVGHKYRPDIHLYIDTSGSITKSQYEEAVQTCIVLIKKLNVNLYISFFSHYLGPETLLQTRDRSAKNILQQIEALPKPTGGTDFHNVWNYINASKERRKRLSIMVTDFEYEPPNVYFQHPQNLYYLPVSKTSWYRLAGSAKIFLNKMKPFDRHMRVKMLF